MLENRPDRPFWGRAWVETALEAHVPGYQDPRAHRLQGWSMGGCVGTETLVQSRPLARATDNLVDDLLRAEARCSLGSIHGLDPQRPHSVSPPRVARFRRWLAVIAGPPLAEATRAEVLRTLPAFLGRDAARAPDAQIQLLALLADLYAATGYQNAYADPSALADALARFLAQRGDEAPRALFVSDGRTLGASHEHGCLLVSHPPPDLRPSGALMASPADHLPASLWIWNEQTPTVPPRDAERVAPGIFTVTAAEPGNVVRR